MNRGNLSRRGFMQRSLATMVGAGLPLWAAREVFEHEVRAAEQDSKPASSLDKLRIGLVGCGGQGRGIMRQAMGDPNVEVVAVCDVDRRRREETIARDLKGSKEVKSYEDYRELCDRKDINVVLIGTPDHWHTLVAIDAMRKGKDVYCEKPLTLTIAEGKALVKVAKATKAIFQVGSQQRSDARFRHACELARNGRLGKIKTIETWIGANPRSPTVPVAEIPEGFNWDFWLGPTPKTEFRYLEKNGQKYSNNHYEFRWWYAYSGGKLTDWGAHHNDIAQWALGMDESGPIEVVSKGEKPSSEPHSYDCHPTFEVTYTYANGTKVICKSKENGVRIEGEDGKWIFVSRSLISASDQAEKPVAGRKGVPGKRGGPSKILDEPLAKDATRLYVSTNHMRNFLEGVRTRKPCICTAEIGHRSVSVCHMGAISLRLGEKKLTWDPVKEEFGEPEANEMLSRPYRGEWKLEA